jgi:UDP-N-acetylglucosamine:LPS N-acetylglucosamine transferase
MDTLESAATGERQSDQRPLILVTVEGGGWHHQTVRILRRLSPAEFRFAYVYGHVDEHHYSRELAMPHAGARYPIHHIGQTRGRPWRHVTNVGRLALSFWEAWQLLVRLRPAAILAVATPVALPLFVVGRLLGVRCLFVESLTRVRDLSLTGRLIYRLRLAHRLYVQWPGLRERYARTSFAGAIV